MLAGQKHSIRKTIKKGGEETRKEIDTMLKLSILFLANTYTGAKFSNPPTQEQKFTIETCSSFIIEMFSMLGIKEIEQAFKMAAANKFKGLNLETYYGKFTVQFLGKVLSSYLDHRRNVLGKYSQKLDLEENKRKAEDTEEKNIAAQNEILKEYSRLKKRYEEGKEIDFDIKTSWAKFLDKKGIINFTPEQKKEIHNEAKILLDKELRKELMDTKTKPVRINKIKHTLKRMKENGYCSDYKASLTAKYAKLLVLKSIING